MILDLSQFNRIEEYISKKDIKEFLNFYNLTEKENYIDLIKNACLHNESIILISQENNEIRGFIVGIMQQNKYLNDKIGTIIFTMYDDTKYLEDLVMKYENAIKIKNYHYVNVRIPNFQSEALKILASHGFVNYKVELEKKLD